ENKDCIVVGLVTKPIVTTKEAGHTIFLNSGEIIPQLRLHQLKYPVSFGKLPSFSETISLSPDLQSEDNDVISGELGNLPNETEDNSCK
ncbi:5336_t:CDS:2, partial [Ambispora leptoticha]